MKKIVCTVIIVKYISRFYPPPKVFCQEGNVSCRCNLLNLAQSMSEYVVAFKDIAPYIAAHILKLTQDLNQNITRNSGGCKDNCVKIHTIALAPNLEFLQKLASVTGGQFYHASNVFDFKKQLLTLSADGKPFDMRELDNVIRPSEIHKLWDPDDPNDNPPPQGQGRE